MSALHQAAVAIGDLLDILPDGVVMVDERGSIVYANPAVSELLGYAPSELVDKPLSVLVPPGVRERHEPMMARFRREGRPTMMTHRPVLHAVHRSGRLVAVSISLCNLAVGEGKWVSVAVMHDVSSLHTHLDRATSAAETDALTGVGNRLRLTRRMTAMFEAQRPFALLYMDLTAFKPLNDTLGHAAGDEALRIVGKRLQSEVREADLVARIGGDEFVVLIDGLQNPAALRARARSALARLEQPMHLRSLGDAPPVALGVNIGGAISPLHGHTEAELLAAADRAMYQAKQAREGYRLAGA